MQPYPTSYTATAAPIRVSIGHVCLKSSTWLWRRVSPTAVVVLDPSLLDLVKVTDGLELGGAKIPEFEPVYAVPV